MTHTSVFRPAALVLALALAGCSGNSKVVSQQDISAAQQGGTLEQLYEQMTAQLAEMKPGSAKQQEFQARVNQVGAELSGKLEQQVRAGLAKAPAFNGLIQPKPIAEAIEKLRPIEHWDSVRYQRILTELTEQQNKTRGAITRQNAALEHLGENDAVQKMSILADLARLTGDAGYDQKRVDLLEELRHKGEEALKSEQFSEAQRMLKMVNAIAPDDKVNQQLLQVDARLYEQKFNDALGQGNLDDAYGQFMTIADTSRFNDIKPYISKSADTMMEYFVASASAATQDGKLSDAYRWFTQARDMRQKMNPTVPLANAQEKAFVGVVYQRAQQAVKAGYPGVALSQFKVVEDFSPEYPGLKVQIRSVSEAALAKAIKRVSTAAFSNSSSSGQEFGKRVASLVTQNLFEKIPNDIRIIERQDFEAVQRETQLSSNGNKSSILSADLLIQGSITESRVDTTEKQSKKTMRVVTDTVNMSNPEYDQWVQLDESKRRHRQQPDRFISTEKKEDITISITVVRKVGVFSASFRLIDANTGKLLATDAMTVKDEYTDESNEGVDLGKFHMPFKLASLPSDLEILEKLSQKISLQIGDKLVAELSNPETRYIASAERKAGDGNLLDAAEDAGYAFIIAEQKKQETPAIRRKMQQYGVAASLTGS